MSNTQCSIVDAQSHFIDVDKLETALGVQKIAWPFIISGAWCVITSSGYAILGKIARACA
jgi:hypothetical protein